MESIASESRILRVSRRLAVVGAITIVRGRALGERETQPYRALCGSKNFCRQMRPRRWVADTLHPPLRRGTLVGHFATNNHRKQQQSAKRVVR